MKKLLTLLFFSIFLNINFAQEILDQVAAVVDNEVILESEVNFRTNMLAAQQGLNASDPEVREQVLNMMIEEKLLYAQAEADTIIVSPDEIDGQLDYQMNYYVQQYGSRERVEEMYGMSMDKIKRELREDVRKNLMAQRVQSEKFRNVEVTRREVEEFFKTYKDSLGTMPEKYEIAHIFINPNENARLKSKTRVLANSILDSIKNGADFEELAKKMSDDPGSASQGGDLGFVKRGVFYPEFEAAAFALEPGEISKVIESPVGFHIIELLERRGDAIHARHILFKVESDDEADLEAIELLSEIRDSILNGKKSFAYYAKKYSDDDESSVFGGDLGTFKSNELDPAFADAVLALKKGEISFPKRLDLGKNNYGFHIIKLKDKVAAHEPSLAKDYADLENLASFRKKQELYKEWMDELKDKIYWEVKI